MDHHWRASHAPIQGNNICPRCSTPHFPLCPPNPNNPAFPVDPIHFQSHPPPYPPYTTIPDPFHPPRYPQLNPNHNPNLNGGSHSQYHANYNRVGGGFTQGFEYGSVNGVVGMGGDYGVDDRSSKRLKVDGMGSEGFRDPSMGAYGDDERRLKLIHDHGRGGMNGLGPIEQEYKNNNPRFLETSSNTLYGQAGYRYTPGGSNEGPGQRGQRFYANNVDNRHSHYDHTKYAIPQNGGHYPTSEEIGVQPPLPTTPPPLPPPLPLPNRGDTPGQWMSHPNHSPAPARMSSLLFPIDVSSSTPVHSSYPAGHDAHSLAPPNQHSSQHVHFSGGLFPQNSQGPQTAMSQHSGHGQPVLLHHNVSDKPKIIDALSLFKPPNRNRRPDHFVIILRGLPGSGKSYLARVLRDLEVEHGGKAPRIHSMDDYFMTEVEKVEENETSKSSVRGKKPTPKTVLEYCYEPEMEEAYRSSMLKAFKKTLDEGAYTFTIVDDRNLRVADFAQFWATAKRSGYEVYLLETSYKDPVGCTARNIHGFTRDDVEKMAGIWEEAPSIYLQLDAKSLFHGDDIKESNIQEVDMEMDDEDLDRGPSEMKEIKQDNVTVKTSKETGYDGLKDKKTWDAEADHPDEGIKDLRSSKWSSNLDEDDAEGRDKAKGKSTALSGLFQTYGKEGKTVRWGDQISNTGFSIAAMKKANAGSLIIGSGSGYNLKSNPLRVEESHTSAQKSGDVKQHHHVFQERLRAERESFKVVFDKRRHRIGGVDED